MLLIAKKNLGMTREEFLSISPREYWGQCEAFNETNKPPEGKENNSKINEQGEKESKNLIYAEDLVAMMGGKL